jgi:hypothetical protein
MSRKAFRSELQETLSDLELTVAALRLSVRARPESEPMLLAWL